MKKKCTMMAVWVLLTCFANAQTVYPTPEIVTNMSKSETDSISNYIVNGATPGSQFKIALSFEKELKLSSVQKKEMIANALTMYRMLDNAKQSKQSPNAVRNFQCIEMQKALSPEQYQHFLNLKNTPRSTGEALDLWSEIRYFNIRQSSDSLPETKQLITYKLLRFNAMDRFANNPVKQRLELADIDRTAKPAFIRELLIHRSLAAPLATPSLFTKALAWADSLKLSAVQQQQLKEKAAELAKIKIDCRINKKDEKTAERKFQYTEITHVLSPAQYEKLLTYKNMPVAIQNAISSWKEIRRFNLRQSADSTRELALIVPYQLLRLHTMDKYANDKNAQSNELSKIDKTARPASIRELAVHKLFAEPLAMKNLFTLALSIPDSLRLTDAQRNQLKEKATTLAKIKIDCRITGKDERAAEDKFKFTVLQQILTPVQYEKLLTERNRSDAQKNAIILWKEIKQRQLNGTTDSVTTVTHLTAYTLAKRNAKYLYANDKARLNSVLKEIDSTMPMVVRALYTARKQNTAAEKSAKAAFVW